MFSNVPFSSARHGQKGNHPSVQSSKDPLTLKVRASRILRAYINAPSGQAAEGIFRALASLDPLPTFREAAQLTEKIPAVTQSRALTRFFALLEAQEETKGCADGGRGHYDPCQCPRKLKERKGGKADGGKDQPPQKPSQALTTPDRFRGVFGTHVPAQGVDLDRPQPAKGAPLSEEALEIRDRIEAESQGSVLEAIQNCSGVNREIALQGLRIFKESRYGTMGGEWPARQAALREVERKLAVIIPPEAMDALGKPLTPWAFQLHLGLAPMVIGIHQRERYAREVHQGIYRGGMSEEEKTELIGEIIFGEHGYTAHRRNLEATKWRAGEDYKTLRGDGPEDPGGNEGFAEEGGAA